MSPNFRLRAGSLNPAFARFRALTVLWVLCLLVAVPDETSAAQEFGVSDQSEQVERMAFIWANDLMGTDRSFRGRLISMWAWTALSAEGAKALFQTEQSYYDGFAAHSELSRLLLASPRFLEAVQRNCNLNRECFDQLVKRVQRSQVVGTLVGGVWAATTVIHVGRWVYSALFQKWVHVRVAPLLPAWTKRLSSMPVLIAGGTVLTAGSVAWSFKLNREYNEAMAGATHDFLGLMEELDSTRVERSRESVLKAHRERLAVSVLRALEWIQIETNALRVLNPDGGPADLDPKNMPDYLVLSRERAALKAIKSELGKRFSDPEAVNKAQAVEAGLRKKSQEQIIQGRPESAFSQVSSEDLKLWVDYQTWLALRVLLPLLEKYP